MPARLRDLARALASFGIDVDMPSAGSHWKARKEGFGVYPIPAHNGPKSEIGDVYLRGVCRHFGIELAELKSKM
jgi:hypothetical protein